MATTKKRVNLILQQKVEVIQAKQPGSSQQTLAEKFGVRKTQIQMILKKKRELLDAYKVNVC